MSSIGSHSNTPYSAPPDYNYAIREGTTQENRAEKIQRTMQECEIVGVTLEDLLHLEKWDIVFIADSSSSMSSSVKDGNGNRTGTRWQELKKTVGTVAQIATCFDEDGIDVYFFDGEPIKGIKDSHDRGLQERFNRSPRGLTPLTKTFQRVIKENQKSAEDKGKGLLVVIATDGQPNSGDDSDGPKVFKKVVLDAVGQKTRVAFLACSDDKEDVGYLDELDKLSSYIDTTDDYESERQQVFENSKGRLSKGDWAAKSLLGAILEKFDNLDESKKTEKTKNPFIKTAHFLQKKIFHTKESSSSSSKSKFDL